MRDARAALQSPALWLFVTIVATLAPHATQLPPWLMGLCLFLLAVRALLAWRGEPAPHVAILALTAIGAGIGVKYEFGIFFGREPGIAMLAVLLNLKQLECRGARDVRAAILLCFFLQLGLFFHNQSPAVGALALLGALLAVITQLSLQDRTAPPATLVRSSALLLAQGLPFMVVLFVLFPRIPGPLWGLPADAYSGMSGLSDSMSPGAIADLSLSDAIAFRAEFDGAPPPPAKRYWRGPVLTHFDGRTWHQAPAMTAEQPAYAALGRAFDYRLTLEPHNQPWLLALDFPAAGAAAARYASDFRLLAGAPLRTRTRLALRAFPDTPVGLHESAATLAAARRLPDGYNPRSRELAQTLAKGASDHRVIVERVLANLRTRDLVYTLTPPLLGTHGIDEFLFDTRLGFCEHFASAFVFLMRAASVPSRVVTGYQGGEINPVDKALVVRQSDAHAWAEVWLAGRGWLRVDPTAVVAPARIESGLAAALPDWAPRPFLMHPGLSWLRGLRHRWDALSNAWNQWVLGYDPDLQRDLFARAGFERVDWQTYGLLLGASAAALMLLLFAWGLGHGRRLDTLDRAWRRLSRKCARRGAGRYPWEGPIDYGTRLAQTFPEHAAVLQHFAQRYAALRYGPHPDPRAERAFARQIRRFRFR